jgi:hypothetical protein
MEKFKLTDGKNYDIEYFEKLSEDASKGVYPGQPGEWIVKPQGRPRYSEEELVTIAFKVPLSQRDRIDDCAKENHQTRSQFIRSIVSSALA